MSILVVDDDEPMRRYIDRVLSAAGYNTTLAVDGADARGRSSDPVEIGPAPGRPERPSPTEKRSSRT
jgi:hypothetical protein